MKKVLSVALASAMVLGMGANAFAIQYSTGSNDKADWPSSFKFDGSLFVTDKDGNIVKEATTAINDNEAVNFEPGDVIWMPLYADDQYAYTAKGSKGTDAIDAVSNIKLGAEYFNEGVEASAPSVGTEKDYVKDLGSVEITLNAPWGTTTAPTVTLGTATNAAQPKITFNGNEATVSFKVSKSDHQTLFGEAAPSTYTAKEVSVNVTKSDDFDANGESKNVNVGSVAIATVTEGAANGTAAKAAQLKEIPTTVEVSNGTTTTTRTVESAKAVVNGKTFTANKPADFDTLVDKVNAELKAMVEAGKSAMVKDVTVTVNLAKVDATDDVIGKPVIDEVVSGDKVMVDYGHYTGNIDKNWSINLIEKSTGVAELIEKAELYKATSSDYLSYKDVTTEIMPNAVYLKITLEDEWKTTTSETLKYYVYIADNKAKDHKTNEVWVSGKYENTDYEWVNFDWTNDASRSKLWKVHDDENGVAVFDFADKAFFSVKMYGGETMYLDLETAYDKAIAGEMDAEADSFYKFTGSNANFARTGELIIVSDDSSLVPYQIDEDGNFVAVDAEYVENYAVAHTNKKVNGFVFNTKQLGNYVLSTEELGEEEEPAEPAEEPDEEPAPAEPVEETPAPEENKPNPNTGAEDFVGLAVSLAVVSVAAAGALALKK
ncbi:MAG: hypothetical protein ACLRXW_09305 [Negativibacillus massiliensis]|uniref:hypothetical protein n=1 Tax=Negativibacillus massiliensis TaxID=1871035 RepID=UPI0039A1F284